MGLLMGLTDTEAARTQSGFQYSHADIGKLGAVEYTIVQLMLDWTGSVSQFKTELVESIKMIIEACEKHPRSENILLRICLFNSDVKIQELCGFVPLSTIDLNSFNLNDDPDGGTPLYDVTGNALEALLDYGKKLHDQEYNTNAVIFVITDGEENSSRTIKDAKELKKIGTKLRDGELLESFVSILIGINDQNCQHHLDNFKTDGGFDSFVSMGQATKGKLAKMANIVSQSISTVSQSLGGGNSQQLSNQINQMGF